MAAKIWVAAQLVDVIRAGRTRPLILRCAPGAKPEAAADTDVVTKALGCPEITRESLFAELFGTLLAGDLGVLVADPGIVKLDADFVDLANRQDSLVQEGIQLVPSVAFGSRYAAGLELTGSMNPQSEEELSDAASIFAFDVLLQNPDRTRSRMNVARSKGRFLAYDFELCFSFVRVIGKKPKPHEVSKNGIGEKHCFWRALRGQPAAVDGFLSRLAGLSNDRIEEIGSSAPKDWQKYRAAIVDHLKAARSSPNELRTEFEELLT